MSAHRIVEVLSGVVQTEAGVPAKLTVDGAGALKTAGGAGGGGDASAANQLSEIQRLSDLYDTLINIGSIDNAIQGVLVDTQTYTFQFSSKFPTEAVPGNNETVPSVTKIQSILSAVEPNSGKLYKVDIDTNRRLAVLASTPAASTTSNSSSYQIQRTAAAFSCTLRAFEAFSTSAGYVVLIDKATAAANGDFPKGGSVWPIAAGGRVEKEWIRGKNFSAGCVIALCTAVSPTITLAGSADMIVTVELD